MSPIPLILFISYHAAAATISGKILVPPNTGLGAGESFVVFADKCSMKSPANDTVVLKEQNKAYHPEVLVGVEGQKLVIQNADTIQHNSFALKAQKFDSGLQKQNSAHSEVLKKAGVTKIFCRIHPSMQASLLTVKNPCFTVVKSGGGEFNLPNIPEGPATVFLWNPRLKAPKKESIIATGKNEPLKFSVNSKEIEDRDIRPGESEYKTY